jgi:hypothetical protein
MYENSLPLQMATSQYDSSVYEMSVKSGACLDEDGKHREL